MQYKKKFGAKYLFKKNDVQQKKFMQDLALLVVKNHLLFNLCIVYGWNILQCIYVVQELCFL
jgi:hypothetical protein